MKITEAGPQENSSQSPQTPAPEAGNTSQPSSPSAGTVQGQTQGEAHSTSGEHAPTPPAASEGNSQSQGASSPQEGSPKAQETSGTQEEGGKQPQTVTTPPANGEQSPQSPAQQQQEGKVSQASAPEGSDPQLKNESHDEATGQHSEASQRALPLQFKDLLGHEELFGEASPTADNGHISYAPSSSLVSNLIDPLHEVPMV